MLSDERRGDVRVPGAARPHDARLGASPSLSFLSLSSRSTLTPSSRPQIHTHPTQSIFLSSLDLHTHLGFQLLLREAIAVVCAPIASDDEPQCGVFRMTDPPGMGAVAACREGGAFHPQ